MSYFAFRVARSRLSLDVSQPQRCSVADGYEFSSSVLTVRLRPRQVSGSPWRTFTWLYFYLLEDGVTCTCFYIQSDNLYWSITPSSHRPFVCFSIEEFTNGCRHQAKSNLFKLSQVQSFISTFNCITSNQVSVCFWVQLIQYLTDLRANTSYLHNVFLFVCFGIL